MYTLETVICTGVEEIFYKMFKLITVSTYALLCFSASVLANTPHSYMGADILYSHEGFKDGYGSTVFTNTSVTQLNFFAGYMFNKFIGVECGYEQNLKQSDLVTIAPINSSFGVKNFTTLVSNAYYTKSSMSGLNLNLVPQLQVSKRFFIIPVLGFVYIRSHNTMDLNLFDGDPATQLEVNNYYVSFAESKIIPRLGMRLQYVICKVIGVRASYIWEKTDLMQPTSTRQINPTQRLQAKFKNRSAVGVGMSMYF